MEDRMLLRISEAAKTLGISRSKAYEMAQAGQMPGVVKFGKSVRVSPTVLQRWIEENATLAGRR